MTRRDNPRPPSADPLAGFLAATAEYVGTLNRGLDAAAAAIAAADAAQLESELRDNDLALAELDRLFQAQCRDLQARGLPANRDGLEQALCAHPDPALSRRWQQLRGELENCRKRNLINAQTARQAATHANAALRVLRGATEEPAYDRDGGLQHNLQRQEIGRA